MSNRRELARARRILMEATADLERVEALPRRVGSTVTWSNGVVWTRQGDDSWMPWTATQPEGMNVQLYTSLHVASGTIVEESGS